MLRALLSHLDELSGLTSPPATAGATAGPSNYHDAGFAAAGAQQQRMPPHLYGPPRGIASSFVKKPFPQVNVVIPLHPGSLRAGPADHNKVSEYDDYSRPTEEDRIQVSDEKAKWNGFYRFLQDVIDMRDSKPMPKPAGRRIAADGNRVGISIA